MDRDTALAFFFAIFWSVAISGMKLLRVFHVWDYAAYARRWWIAIVRLLYGVAIVNVLPFGLFVIAQKVVPARSSMTAWCACVASLSVFSICFFLPCALQWKLGKMLYPHSPSKRSWKNAAEEAEMGTTGTDALISLGTGLLYCLIPMGAAFAIARWFAESSVPTSYF
jgi:hypothetical protein